MKDRPPVAEDVLRLISSLSDAERDRFWNSVIEFIVPIIANSMQHTLAHSLDQELERFKEFVRAKTLEKYKLARDPKPRNRGRDAELVRLVDDEGAKDWRHIRVRLGEMNPAWARGAEGRPVSLKALKVAYRREKKRRRATSADAGGGTD